MSELEIIRHGKLGGISLFFDTVEYRTPHFHPEWELIWLVRGSLSVRCGHSGMDAQTGDLLLFSPNRVHEFRQLGGPATFLCLQIAPQSFEQLFPELQAFTLDEPYLSRFLDAAALERLRSLLRELMACYLDGAPFFELRCTALCAQVLHTLLSSLPVRRMSEEERSSADRRSARLTRFLEYVDEHYRQNLRLADFAAQEGCSVSYLSRFLKENLNQTFQDYVNQIRFHCACRLIRSGALRMIDVCEESGFSDYRYFSNTFKKQCGMTPEEYSRSSARASEQPHQSSVYSVEHFCSEEESYAILRSL